MVSTREKIITRVIRWATAMIGMEYSRNYRYDWFKTGSGDCSAYVFAMWLAGLCPLTGIKGMTSMYEVYADGFDLMFPSAYDRIGKDWAPKGFYKTFQFEPGDIIFYCRDKDTPRANKITHVSCNYNNKQIIHTRLPGENACLADMSYGDGSIVAVIRLKQDAKEYELPDTTQSAATTMTTRIMQAWLNYHGAVLRCDGDWGSKTAAALNDFKAANGLSGDGSVIDSATWNALTGESSQPVVIPKKWTCSRVLKPGMKGRDVYDLELALEAQGLDCGMTKKEHETKIGVFGSMCKKAFREWQLKNPECGTKGKPDNQAGRKSITKLGGVWTGR